ncbi:MAG: hypothetical protein C3L25_01600 [Candidatus Sedimenticola endophacoides]|uniref:TonB C-terminal domain-containing protein n=1 Tax=Candidatus Sedimenticola endophacoides TaxID=2548426 RepID=A0A6N4DQ13_9GAMM|nr:MAG: hypothetical protein C3L24_11635 [Candidatus Sedimenticola endophacoides]PUE02342.1 MAG: hypothetical protein C3L26_01605 [Candidatus Sedimenticola endophacoides]PUE05203.1 MAG: hypothetical protein C3L25_01600 [Candidatus Sedimenticola endophacoides]
MTLARRSGPVVGGPARLPAPAPRCGSPAAALLSTHRHPDTGKCAQGRRDTARPGANTHSPLRNNTRRSRPPGGPACAGTASGGPGGSAPGARPVTPPRPQRQARTTTAARASQPESRAQLPPSGAHDISLDDRAGIPPSPVDSALDGTDNGRPPDTDPNLRARQQLLAWLEHELGRHFSYPRRAWRRGWEGTVRLAFEVEPGSGITNIRIAASSGHALLDSNARDTLRRIAEMGVPPLPSHGGRIALSLPVVYQRY